MKAVNLKTMITVVESRNLGRPDNIANATTNVTSVFEYHDPAISSRRLIGLFVALGSEHLILSICIKLFI